MNLLENSDIVFLKEDINRFISRTELDLRDIRGLRYADLKKVNFFVGHPVSKKIGPIGPLRALADLFQMRHLISK